MNTFLRMCTQSNQYTASALTLPGPLPIRLKSLQRERSQFPRLHHPDVLRGEVPRRKTPGEETRRRQGNNLTPSPPEGLASGGSLLLCILSLTSPPSLHQVVPLICRYFHELAQQEGASSIQNDSVSLQISHNTSLFDFISSVLGLP